MPSNEVRVVLVHGAWADGSSWAKVIAPLAAQGFNWLPRHCDIVEAVRACEMRG